MVSPASGPDWTKIIGDTPNAPLAKIAYASQMAGPNWCSALAIGPSRLWALDTAGNIYVANSSPSTTGSDAVEAGRLAASEFAPSWKKRSPAHEGSRPGSA